MNYITRITISILIIVSCSTTAYSQNIDINWDTRIDMKVNSWLSANFAFQMVYDHETPVTDKDGNIGPRLQMKKMLSVGLAYKVSNRK